MKKLAFAFLCAASMSLMVSCGNSSNENKAGNDIVIDEETATEIVEQLDLPEDGVHGYTGDAATDLKNVTNDNYLEIAKGIFGVDLSPKDGWKFVEAKSPNKVNNLNVKYNIEGLSEAAEAEALFNQCLAVTSDGNYPVKMDWNTGAMSRGPKCDTYEAYKENKDMGNMWFYAYGDKTVMMTVSSWKEELEISMVLTSN